MTIDEFLSASSCDGLFSSVLVVDRAEIRVAQYSVAARQPSAEGNEGTTHA